MYFDEAQDDAPISAGPGMHVVLSANGLAVLALGLFPAALVNLCRQALGLG